jgi:AraC-like DNA-binding protein
MKMHVFENTILTDIRKPFIVFSEKGRKFSTESRRVFGLSFCINGQITYTQNGKTFVSQTGNAVLLPKGAAYKLYGDKEGVFPVIDFDCVGLDVDEITLFPLKDPAQYLNDFQELLHSSMQNNKRLRLFALLYGILDKLDSEQSTSPLAAIIGHIETHLSNSELSNTFLSQKMGISEVYLRKLFVTHLHVTPKQYILNLRIKAAQQLLINSSKNITQISEECGFSSLYHFCRIFKQKTSFTPSEYILKNRAYKI